MMNRMEVIEALVEAMADEMQVKAVETSALEDLSAAMLFTLRLLKGTLKVHPELRETARLGTHVLVMTCADEKRH